MPTYTGKDQDGTPFTAIICGRGLHECTYCSGLATRQCDFIIARAPRSHAVLRRCDRYLCANHATSLAKDKDACPEHAPACLAALQKVKQD